MPPPASSFKKAPKKPEAALTAVIVLDSFDQRFAPILQENPCFGLLPICNVPAINYTFSWLVSTEIQNIMLVVTGKNAKYAENIEAEWKSAFEEFQLIICDCATSVGDCLREIHNRELITSEFLLIVNPTAVTSSNLTHQICEFRKRREENDDNVMTLIYAKCENRDFSAIGINSETKKLMLFPSADNPAKLKVDKPDFLQPLEIRRDVTFSGIALCSRLIVTQFSDNFDFQNLNDVIREILSKDEVIGLNVHIDVLDDQEAAFQAVDYDSLIHLNNLMLERWFYPLTPEKADVSKYIKIGARNVYIEESDPSISRFGSRITLNEASVNVAMGKLAKCSDNAKLINVSVGEFSQIDVNSVITNSIIGKNCKIGKNCIINNSIICDNVEIIDNSKVLEQTIIGSNVIYTPEMELSSEKGAIITKKVDENQMRILVSKVLKNNEKHYHLWQMAPSSGILWKVSRRNNGNIDESEDEVDDEDKEDYDDFGIGGAMDSTKQFFEEVFESMKEMLSLNDQQMSNLILEINSSKLACNVAIDELARNVFAAFLALPGNNELKTLLSLLKKWKPLFFNYYKSTEEGLAGKSALQRKVEWDLKRKCQIQMLLAIEDKFEKEPKIFGPKVPKLVHFLYNDVDVLDEEAILEWAESIEEESELNNLIKPIVDWLKEEDEEDSD